MPLEVWDELGDERSFLGGFGDFHAEDFGEVADLRLRKLLFKLAVSQEPVGGVALRIKVHNEHFFLVVQSKARPDVDGVGGLAHAAFEVEKSDNFCAHTDVVICEFMGFPST